MKGRPTITCTVRDDDDGSRADVVLGRRIPELSRRVARTMALDGRLRIDGHRAAPSTRVRAGQVLELSWPTIEPPDPLALTSILRVTDAFVYVDKPPGVHTHRLRPSDPPALADAVVTRHPECATASAEPREQGAVHRLDKTTSGVVAFARTPSAWVAARRALADGTVEKLYFAVCRWRPEQGAAPSEPDASSPPFPASALDPALRPRTEPPALSITAPIGRGHARDRVRIRADGLPARTLVWRLDPDAASTGVVPCLLRLFSGRRHQARVHLAHVGLPIVGDAFYGCADGASRPLLHALRIDLSTCCRDETPVAAPMPPDITACLTGGTD
jgi:23S rRNA pseudouridine1911/1915/1917 synthase